VVLVQPEVGPKGLRIAQWGSIRWWNACAWYHVSLADALARRGHGSWVLAPRQTPTYREAAERGIAVVDLGDLSGENPASWWRGARSLRRFLRRERIDAMNVHTGAGHALCAWVCHRAGIPLVRTRGDIRVPRADPLHRFLYGRATQHHLAAADFLADEVYPPLGVPRDRVTVLRGGVDLGRLAAIVRADARKTVRERLGLAPDAPLIGMVARLSPVKGHADLIRAMAAWGALRGAVHCVMAGPDAQLSRDDLRTVARAAGLADRIHLVGRVDDPFVWSAALDVAVIASVDSEAICRSAFEYMGLGVPLVATAVHAIREVVQPGTGLLVSPESPDALAAAIGRLLDEPALRRTIGAAGRAHVVANYGLDRFGLDAERMFAAVIGGARR